MSVQASHEIPGLMADIVQLSERYEQARRELFSTNPDLAGFLDLQLQMALDELMEKYRRSP